MNLKMNYDDFTVAREHNQRRDDSPRREGPYGLHWGIMALQTFEKLVNFLDVHLTNCFVGALISLLD